MTPELQQHFERLEVQRAALLSRAEGLDAAALARPPAAGKWSVLQVLSHLTVAEKLSLAAIRKQMADRSGLEKAGLAGWLRSAFLRVVLRSPLRIKAPARAVPAAEHQDLASVRRQWDEVRAGWREMVGAFPPELAGQGIFRHPVVGALSLAQALQFIEDHVGRHARQVERIAESG